MVTRQKQREQRREEILRAALRLFVRKGYAGTKVGDIAEAVEDAFRYDKMVTLRATYDGGLFPCTEEFLHHLKSKAYQKRKVALVENGSWAPMAAKLMRGIFEGMKEIEVCEKTVSIRSAMKADTVKELEELADELLAM